MRGKHGLPLRRPRTRQPGEYRLSQSNMYLFGPNDVPVLRERAAIVDVKRRVLDLLDGKKDVRL